MDAKQLMYEGYVKAFLWAESPLPDEDSEDSDLSLEDLGYTVYQITPESASGIRRDCATLYRLIMDAGIVIPDDQWEQAGMDLHFTRQHHGTGFWDNPKIYGKEQAERLTQLVHENFKTVYAWIDDTNYIQIMEG